MRDRFMDDPPDMPYLVHDYDQLPPRIVMGDSHRPPEADLMDMVVHLQLEVLKCVQSGPSRSVAKALPVQFKPAVFTSTKVPKLSGVKVFDAIVRSNGWGDAAVTLQLLSHLKGTH